MSYKIKNGVLFLENGDTLVIPAMNDVTGENIILDEKVSPFVYENIDGDFEISAKFIPEHMSFTDFFGIYVVNGDCCGYVTMEAKSGRNCIKSGMVDVIEMENPKVIVDGAEIYLKIIKRENHYTTFFSKDGKQYIPCGEFTLILNDIEAGFLVSSFQGSKFQVEVQNICKHVKANKNVA